MVLPGLAERGGAEKAVFRGQRELMGNGLWQHWGCVVAGGEEEGEAGCAVQ